MIDKSLMRYIPREYKKDVVSIQRGNKTWNNHTKRWNTSINVVWSDDTENEYTNATHMYWKLKEFGRD